MDSSTRKTRRSDRSTRSGPNDVRGAKPGSPSGSWAFRLSGRYVDFVLMLAIGYCDLHNDAMGRVFLERQIENGEVPTLEDFNYAAQYFRSSVEQEIEAGTVDGAVIFGSVAIGAATIRSDLDCMIVPVDHSAEAFDAIARIRGAVFNYAHRVPVNSSLHHRTRLASGNHEIDRFFGSHLTGEQRVVIGNDPADYMRFRDTPAEDILLGYIAHKMRGVAQLPITYTPEEHAKAMQRILELPLAVGRKALRAIDEIEGSTTATTDSANKSLVAERSLALFSELGVDGAARRILEFNGYYDEELEWAMSTKRTHGYAKFFEELDALTPEASQWLDALYVSVQGRLALRR